jgi:hypothetical protein
MMTTPRRRRGNVIMALYLLLELNPNVKGQFQRDLTTM